MRSVKAPLFFLVLLLLCCTQPVQAARINLSAAASLKESLNELSDSYLRKHPGVQIIRNYGASGALAKQVENGAPADVFISANLPWVDYLRQHGLLSGGVTDFAYNSLVVVGGQGVKASSLKDLLQLSRIAIGSPRSVPAGEYAMEAFKNSFIERQLEKKLVMAKDARECLMYAERGDVEGALVYRTDALEAKKSRILFTVPQNLYERIAYPMALTVSGARNKDAQAFFQFLKGPEAKNVLAKYGFAVK